MAGRGINTSELNGLIKKLEYAGANIETIGKKAISAAYPLVRDTMAANMPKSAAPRQPSKNDRWRTGIRASDALAQTLRPTFNLSLRKTSLYSLVGPRRLRGNEPTASAISKAGPYFYAQIRRREAFYRRPATGF